MASSPWSQQFNNFKKVKRFAHHFSGMSLKHNAFDKLCCEVCEISKSRRQPVSRKMEKRKSLKRDLVFTDILKQMLSTSLGGNRYAISFTDSYSRYSAIYFLKSKEECLDKFKVFCAQMGTPRAIRSDNGTASRRNPARERGMFVRQSTTLNLYRVSIVDIPA